MRFVKKCIGNMQIHNSGINTPQHLPDPNSGIGPLLPSMSTDEGEDSRQPMVNPELVPPSSQGIYAQGGQEFSESSISTVVDRCNAAMIPLFLSGANLGDAECLRRLGQCYEKGTGVPKDVKQAFLFLYAAAERNSASAMYDLAKLYLKGDGVDIDYEKAFFWFWKAAQAGFVPTMAYVAAGYQSGIGVPIDQNRTLQKETVLKESTLELKTAEVILCAVKTHNLAAMIILSMSDQSGYIRNKETFLSVKRNLQDFALTGLRQIEALGVHFLVGSGVEKDPVKAFILFSAGAELGDAKCMNALGCCYFNATGVEKNFRKAIELFTKSANESYPTAQCNLAYCYQHKFGGTVRTRLRAAKRLQNSAAQAKYTPGMNQVGLACLFGLGESRCTVNQRSKKRLQKGFGSFQTGAQAGDPSCMHNLASCYKFGLAVERNPEQAAEWYKKAAAQDNARLSQLPLQTDQLLPGVCYRFTEADINPAPTSKKSRGPISFLDLTATISSRVTHSTARP